MRGIEQRIQEEPVQIPSSPPQYVNPYVQYNPYTHVGARGEAGADDQDVCSEVFDLEGGSRADSDEDMCPHCIDEFRMERRECSWCLEPLISLDGDQLGNNEQSSANEHCRAANPYVEIIGGVAVDIASCGSDDHSQGDDVQVPPSSSGDDQIRIPISELDREQFVIDRRNVVIRRHLKRVAFGAVSCIIMVSAVVLF